jgi:hypothetical protein
MQRKAFRFDCEAFDTELRERLHNALLTNDAAQLASYINSATSEFSDPYEGEALTADWTQVLSDPNDVHELGDYALTRFYDPTADFGIGDAWIAVDESLSDVQRNAILGLAIGPATNSFDPGKMGSYVQTRNDVVKSRSVLREVNDERLAKYINLLDQCASSGHGVYVTF